MNELNVGDKVMMIEDELHAEHPEYYPTKGQYWCRGSVFAP